MNADEKTSETGCLLNYYAILGLSEDASIEEIKKRYKALLLQHHPDKNVSSATSYAEDSLNFVRLLNGIWKTLSDEARKQKYDQKLKQSNGCQNAVIGDVITYKDLDKVEHDGNNVKIIQFCRCGNLCVVLEHFQEELITVLGCEFCSQLILVNCAD